MSISNVIGLRDLSVVSLSGFFDENRTKMFDPTRSRKEFLAMVEHKILEYTVGSAKNDLDNIDSVERHLGKLTQWRNTLEN